MYRIPPEITSDSSKFAESAQTMWAFECWRPLARLRRTAKKTVTFWTKIIGVNALRTSDSTSFFSSFGLCVGKSALAIIQYVKR
jgi:hypothetical protein